MNKNLIKSTLILGTLAAASAGLVALLSKDDNRKKVQKAANDLSVKANTFVKELEEDYKELDKNLGKYSKTREYKEKVDEVSKASREILKQLEILRANSGDLIRAFQREAKKSID